MRTPRPQIARSVRRQRRTASVTLLILLFSLFVAVGNAGAQGKPAFDKNPDASSASTVPSAPAAAPVTSTRPNKPSRPDKSAHSAAKPKPASIVVQPQVAATVNRNACQGRSSYCKVVLINGVWTVSDKVNVCHATNGVGRSGYGFNPISPNADSVLNDGNAHATHTKGNFWTTSLTVGDIVEAFSYARDTNRNGTIEASEVMSYAGRNLGPIASPSASTWDSIYGVVGSSGASILGAGCKAPAPPVVDVCPNIDDIQKTVPAGLIVDANGDCVPPPVVIDVCPNIEEDQATVPAGLIVDAKGDCVPPPVVIDVCPNILGPQALVPVGLTVDAKGDCVLPPVVVDSCPAGQSLVAGVCTLPTTPETPLAPPTTPVTPDVEAGGPAVVDTDTPTITADATDEPAASDADPIESDDATALPFTGQQLGSIGLGGLLAFVFGVSLYALPRTKRPAPATKR